MAADVVVRLRYVGLLLGVALIVSGCGPLAGNPSKTAAAMGRPADYRVWLGKKGECHLGRQFRVLDFNRNRQVLTIPSGIPSPDWTRLYTIDPAEGRLRALDPSSGATVAQTRVPQLFDWPQLNFCPENVSPLSPNGAWMALESVERDPQVWLPTGVAAVTRTHYLIVDTGFKDQPRQVDLNGRWAFDALSNDGRRLYLLQYEAQPPDAHYRVRLYDVAAGDLTPSAIVDEREGGAGMFGGSRLSAIPSPDGGWLYGLYLFGKKGPFIHVLNLSQPIAWGIDLPDGGRQNSEAQLLWSLAMSPDGNRLYAVNGGLGIVAEVVPGNPPRVRRKADFKVRPPQTSSFLGLVRNAEAKRILFGGAALSPDGKTLYAIGDDAVYLIDTVKLSVSRHLLAGLALESLALSPDGSVLFATSFQERLLARVDLRRGITSKSKLDTYWGEVLRVEPLV